MSTPLALTEEQHALLGRHLARSNDVVRLHVPTPKNYAYLGVCRVMIHADDFPLYSPKTSRDVVVFSLNHEGQWTKTIEFTGADLEGRVLLTVDDISVNVDCRVTTAELRAALGLSLRDCRVTVFPGMWEFAFGRYGRWSSTEPVITITPVVEDPFYPGGLLIIDEGWTSITEDGDTPATIETRDLFPFIEGEVKLGSFGLAHWSDEAGWVVSQWRCRPFRFLPLES